MHIVFDDKDAQALEKSFELDEEMRDKIFIVNDDFSVGPVHDTDEVQRNLWMANLKKGNTDEAPLEERMKALFDENDLNEIKIWIAPNNRDVCGYYWLISRLKDKQGKVFTIWLNNLPFINNKGQIFYPKYLAEIPAKEFKKAKKLAQEVSPAVFETDPDEWDKMCGENKFVRLLEGAKKISGRDEDVFDKDLKSGISNEFQKASKVVNQFFDKTKSAISEDFLYWRLREMIHNEQLDVKGDWPDSKNFEVKKIQAGSHDNADQTDK